MEKPMVVVRVSVELVDRDVQFVCTLNEIEALNREICFGVPQDADGLQVLDVGVRAVTADALGVEDPDSDHEILILNRRSKRYADGEWLAAVEDVPGLAIRTAQLNVRDFNLARTPSPFGRPKHVSRAGSRLDRVVRQD